MTTTRVAIIGGGFIGTKHAEAIDKVDGVEVAAVVAHSADSVAAFVEHHDVPGTTDYREVLTDGVDAVLVATPHHLHTDIAIDAARAGKQVMLEKPMALTLDECDAINDAVEASGVAMMVGFTYRFAPHYLVAKGLIESGELGEPVVATSTVSKPWWVQNRRDWHLDRRTGGGMWLVAGIHGLDRMSWLLSRQPTRVAAHFATAFHDIAADDTALALYKYGSDIAGTVVSVGYNDGAVEHTTEITLTEAKLRISDSDGVHIGRGNEWVKMPHDDSAPWPDIAFVNQWSSFRDALRSDEQPEPSGIEARATMSSLFAAEEAAASNQEVEIQHPPTLLAT